MIVQYNYFEENGAFAAHITSRPGHATAMDETHEMVINRIIKGCITRPNPELIEQTSFAIPFRNDCQKQLKNQVGLEDKADYFTEERKDVKVANSNIDKMVQLIKTKQVLDSTGNDMNLANKFIDAVATPDQQHDLLLFRDIGQNEFNNHVNCRLLCKPSAQSPSRLKRLQTFTVTKTTKKKAKQIDKEKKLIQQCMLKQLSICRSGEPLNNALNPPYIPLPRALVDENRYPHKANTATTTNFLNKRYSEAGVIIHQFPENWAPHSVLLEGMFMIQATPTLGVTNFSDYCRMLLCHFVVPHFNKGATEVHVIFDCPIQGNESPKEVEQKKRDEGQNVNPHHEHLHITKTESIPSNWRADLINCRHCKRQLCQFLCTCMLDLVIPFLKEDQKFYSSGALMNVYIVGVYQ